MTETTQIKFAKSERNGQIIGFVSRDPKSHKLKGVRENSAYYKKVCVLAENLKDSILPNVLYEVELTPMHNGKGFVVVSATSAEFEAVVNTFITPGKTYKVTVTFGNKVIFLDLLNGKSHTSRTLSGALSVLKTRCDIKNKEEVITDFIRQARSLIRHFEMDGYIYSESKSPNTM